MWLQELYSQHFILFITYKWAQQGRVFVNDQPFLPSVIWQSSLLGPFVCYEEIWVL